MPTAVPDLIEPELCNPRIIKLQIKSFNVFNFKSRLYVSEQTNQMQERMKQGSSLARCCGYPKILDSNFQLKWLK